jgi:hypothetical protein
MDKKQLIYPFILGVGMILSVMWVLEPKSEAIAADENSPDVWRVATSGLDFDECGTESDPCQTIQYAIDLAQGSDQVLVAAGVYSDVQQRNAITQVVYIDKDISLRGGYTITNWTEYNPISNPTILDARGLGRVVYIAGGTSTVLEGLRITGGNGSGLLGEARNTDAGGGIYGVGSTVTISDCQVFSNTGSTMGNANGGGIYLWKSTVLLLHNQIFSNTASTIGGEGGGVFLTGYKPYYCLASVLDNVIKNNVASRGASGEGGGVAVVFGCNATISHNQILSNTACLDGGGVGGGVYLYDAPASLYDNLIQGNIASAGSASGGSGGGVNIQGRSVTLQGNTLIDNIASTNPAVGGQGGGLWVYGCEALQLVNNVVARNHANTQGSGLWFGGECRTANLVHNTIADNSGIGQGMFVVDATLAMTNTILSGHSSIGIQVSTGSTASLQATLWDGNGTDYGGGGSVMTGTVNVYGNPIFVNPLMGDYHLSAGSPAIDAGIAAGVTCDMDGNSRPLGLGYDLGADEWLLPVLYLPVLLR